MVKGRNAVVGDTSVNQNGYHSTRTEDGWVLTHQLIAAKKLGRPVNSTKERVRFADGDRTNLDPDNILIVPMKNSKQQRIKALETRIAQLQAELTDLRRSGR